MDWRKNTFDWNRARAFLATAEAGSFSAAARTLGLAQPTLSRQVAALEAELDIALFERVGRGLKLTPTGLDMLEHLRVMGEAAGRATLVAAGQSLSLDGAICISASDVMAFFTLPPIIGDIRAAHPGIEIELLATNSASDLRKREADIAIRSFQPKDPELIARKIKDIRAYLYATPEYLAGIGPIETPADLSRGHFIGFDHSDVYRGGLQAMLGLSLNPSNFPILTQSQLVQWELAKAGLGIAIMVEEVGAAEPRVVRALPALPPILAPVWLVSHRELRSSRRVRVVFDLLAAGLGG